MRMVMTRKKYFLPTSHRAADVSKSTVQVQFMAFNQGGTQVKTRQNGLQNDWLS